MKKLIYLRPIVLVAVLLCTLLIGAYKPVRALGDTVDEIHYSYGESAGSVVFNWRGTEQVIYYGLTSGYGQQATASLSAITPVDNPGPFYEVKLTGLQPGMPYHYKIGAQGLDHVFRPATTGDFRWVDVGDTASSACSPWMPAMHQLIGAQQPDVVTHGGDISILNSCGTPAVHAYYTDQEFWSHSAAFQPVWGNHEYGLPTAHAPVGTPRDSLANYKGRSYITNAQTVPNDTATKTGHPGCGEEIGSTTNTCRGEDWGWFRNGGVVFISYPEPWSGALADWQAKADAIMAQAQADTSVDFIVTYGHRPAYTSSGEGPNLAVRSVVEALAAKYSPRADNPTGKYILSVGHHAHGEEVFAPINGLTHITNAAGGQGFTKFSDIQPESVFRLMHFAVLSAQYSASAHSLTVNIVCGADFSTIKDACTYGQTMYTRTFTTSQPSQPDPTPTQWVGNSGFETDLTGWAGKYGGSPYVTVTRVTGSARTGVGAAKITALTGASGLNSGFNDNPRWVQQTTAGKTYTATAWVKPQFSGQAMALRLREWSGSTMVSDQQAILTTKGTDWQQVTVQLTAAQNGTQLSTAVYGRSLSAGQSLLVDDITIVSP